MWLEPQQLGTFVSSEAGLLFEAGTGVDREGQRWYRLRPAGLPVDQTFTIRTTLGWRRLHIAFEPGNFASELLSAMGSADKTGRAAFQAVLSDCRKRGAQVDLRVNGQPESFDGDYIWTQVWNRFSLTLNKGQLELGTEDGEADADIICRWTTRFAAAITAILPLEEASDVSEPGILGYPEGALTTVKVNSYERDRRNRAAAIAIHGTTCAGCGLDFGKRYGSVALGYIEIHHVRPVSKLGSDYVIDPARDLIPLCPNCHAVAHRRDPPFAVEEIRMFLTRLDE